MFKAGFREDVVNGCFKLLSKVGAACILRVIYLTICGVTVSVMPVADAAGTKACLCVPCCDVLLPSLPNLTSDIAFEGRFPCIVNE